MKLTIYLVGLVTVIAALSIDSATRGSEKPDCDCSVWPLKPDPPCFDLCVAKHLAIASLDDLKNIFGLPDVVARSISAIPPAERPHSLEGYRQIIPEGAYGDFQRAIHSLSAASLAQVRRDATIHGFSIEQLRW
jgi:hypothetical protein